MQDDSFATQPPIKRNEAVGSNSVTQELPANIGRFRIEGILGKGGFGIVYLGIDPDLQRKVAIKVPHLDLMQRTDVRDLYLHEARTVAKLEHPNIVPVLEVASSPEHPIYIVSKFVVGQDLSASLKHTTPSQEQSVQWIIDLAEALKLAHREGVVHRDIKPQNTLVDQDGHIYLVDFGFALLEQDVGKRMPAGGTPAYMSPEQAKGEGHRVDGRSDIFSLGVMLYELLTGYRPFRGESNRELFEQITEGDPKPLRQWSQNIPRELERICLKMLAKRKSERYSSAQDLLEDLRAFQHLNASIHPGQSNAPSTIAFGSDSSQEKSDLPQVQTPSSGYPPLRIQPKGLRSFDHRDTEFFLDLIPGVRDRNGLPDSLTFWKDRIEERDAEQTFPVGLLYGPSGCGKSSLIKAGLLPKLNANIMTVYLEATPEATENRLQAATMKRLGINDEVPSIGLVDLFLQIRKRKRLPDQTKLLVIVDQFEQWLATHPNPAGESLTDAFLQCDGTHLQAIVLVRDEFWMAATRFFRALDLPLVERVNSAAVDLFDRAHAERVLIAYGRAFGKLEMDRLDDRSDCKRFIARAIDGLSENDRVISVRMALFAEMMKNRPWTLASLESVGGTSGVGTTFLDETFSSANASPPHRFHQDSARKVLSSLLPEAGSDLKGHMKSQQALQLASGYPEGSRDFNDLIRLLDSELRLITPVDRTSDSAQDLNKETYYQLTHDYLVPSLREWLTRKQRETREGRAELVLLDRTAAWQAKKESKQLPSLWEWLSIRLYSKSSYWNDAQRRMMKTSDRLQLIRFLIATILMATLGFLGWGIQATANANRMQAEARRLVEGLTLADTSQVDNLLEKLQGFERVAQPLLQQAFVDSAPSSNAKLHAALGLLNLPEVNDPTLLDYVLNQIPALDVSQLRPIAVLLESQKSQLIPRLWHEAQDPSRDASKRLQAASVLAAFDAESPNWESPDFVDSIVDQLVRVSPVYLGTYRDLFQPVATKLLPSLARVYRDRSQNETVRTLVVNLIVGYASSNVSLLTELALTAEPDSSQALFLALLEHKSEVIAKLNTILARELAPQWPSQPIDPTWGDPSSAILQRFIQARGELREHDAYCCAMPWASYLETIELLREHGYRPTRIRPWRNGEQPQVAGVWTRDGKRWKIVRLQDRASLNEIVASDKNQHVLEGLLPEDLAILPPNGTTGETSWISLWSEPDRLEEQRRVVFDVEESVLELENSKLSKQGYKHARSIFVRGDEQGIRRYSVIWTNAGPKTSIWTGYAGFDWVDKSQIDIGVGPRTPDPDPMELLRARLASEQAESNSESASDTVSLELGLAHFHLGQFEEAIKYLPWIREDDFDSDSSEYRYHVLALALLDRKTESIDAWKQFQQLNASPEVIKLTEVELHALWGDWSTAWRMTEELTKAADSNADLSYQIACMAAQSFRYTQLRSSPDTDPEVVERFRELSIGILGKLLELGYKTVPQLRSVPELYSLLQIPRLQEICQSHAIETRFATIGCAEANFDSQLVQIDLSQAPNAELVELLGQGYRPRSIVADPMSPNGSISIIVCRPRVPIEAMNQLAAEKGAVSSLHLLLESPDIVWPYFQDQQDPSVASHLLQRLVPYHIDPQIMIDRLLIEPEVPRQRMLIQAIGEYARLDKLSASQQSIVRSELLTRFSQSPDAGVHGSSEWALKQLKATLEVEALQFAMALGDVKEGQNWYIAKPLAVPSDLGEPVPPLITMSVFHAYDEFLMGAPVDDPQRSGGPEGAEEQVHRRRIDRTFALSTTEVTVNQYELFNPQFAFNRLHSRDANAPANMIAWYDAAMFCNWLSEQQGLPPDEWCYDPKQPFAEGMLPYPDYLQRTGYRLPTEAEWEFACRSGTTTHYYFGNAISLLPNYVRYNRNSTNDSLSPVGSHMPNPGGLFDMMGNAFEWCQDRAFYYNTKRPWMDDREQTSRLVNSQIWIMRGGSFWSGEAEMRSAGRESDQPRLMDPDVGFRVARTIRSRQSGDDLDAGSPSQSPQAERH